MKDFYFGKGCELIVTLENEKKINLILSDIDAQQIKQNLIQILVKLNLTEHLLKSIEEYAEENYYNDEIDELDMY